MDNGLRKVILPTYHRAMFRSEMASQTAAKLLASSLSTRTAIRFCTRAKLKVSRGSQGFTCLAYTTTKAMIQTVKTSTNPQEHIFAFLQLICFEIRTRQAEEKLGVIIFLEFSNAVFILKRNKATFYFIECKLKLHLGGANKIQKFKCFKKNEKNTHI